MTYEYPKPDDIRTGFKVSWFLYSNLEDAERAAALAREVMKAKLEQGYDFGYQMPGFIEKSEQGYEVTIP
tara:strand:+ start:56 stop:265 length:210 start_codon:yes stop_codon:yes gene_type:complete